MRAVIKDGATVANGPTTLPSPDSIVDSVSKSTLATASQPWLERFPFSLGTATPQPIGNGWCICDPDGFMLPIAIRYERLWHLIALTGGKSVDLFGEWDGVEFWPLSISRDGTGIVAL
jgi:hypothetical protein